MDGVGRPGRRGGGVRTGDGHLFGVTDNRADRRRRTRSPATGTESPKPSTRPVHRCRRHRGSRCGCHRRGDLSARCHRGAVDSPYTAVTNPLHDPSPDEVARARNEDMYLVGTGHTAVTPGRNYVSLRTCDSQQVDYVTACAASGWAYATGGADSPDPHYGLLGVGDYLTVSALDDHLFVASTSPSTSQDPQSAPRAWLIDSVTGQRGTLTWHEQPATLSSPQQTLVLFPAQPNPYYVNTDAIERFLPRVVDRRDWTIRPLRVPDDATAALSIAQPGSGRIWVGTAPDGGTRAGLHRRRRRILDRRRTSPSLGRQRGLDCYSTRGIRVAGRGHQGPRRGDEAVDRVRRSP